MNLFWCPTSLTDVDGKLKEWPLPQPKLGSFVYNNSCGLRYEAEETRRCIKQRLLECPSVPHKESLLIARIQDEVRKQIGFEFPEDK